MTVATVATPCSQTASADTSVSSRTSVRRSRKRKAEDDGKELRMFSDALNNLTETFKAGQEAKVPEVGVLAPTKLELAMERAQDDDWDFATIVLLSEVFKNEADVTIYLSLRTRELRAAWVNMKMVLAQGGQ